MSNLKRGQYPHLTVTGQKPTIEMLKLYGISINIVDDVMYTLNELGEPIALPLSRDLIVGNYDGYGVPLTGDIPSSVPKHVKNGEPRDLGEVFTHIYYSLPQTPDDALLSKGSYFKPVIANLKGSHVFTIHRRLIEGGKYFVISNGAGQSERHLIPDAIYEQRANLTVMSGDYRTRIEANFSKFYNTLALANTLGAALPDGLDLTDEDLECVFVARTVDDAVRMLSIQVGLMDIRTQLPLVSRTGFNYNGVALTVVL